MPLFNFSDLAMLWPFANEADKTLFGYKQHEEPASRHSRERLPSNERAILVLTGALGRIVMDDSSPDIRIVGPPGSRKSFPLRADRFCCRMSINFTSAQPRFGKS